MEAALILDSTNQSAVWQSQRYQQLQPPMKDPNKAKDEARQVVLYLDSSTERNPFSWVLEFDSRTQGVMTVPLRVSSLLFIVIKNVIIPTEYLQPFFPGRFIILRVRELNIANQYFSNDSVNPQTDILLYNNGVSGPNSYWESRNVHHLRTQGLSGVSRLTFQFLDAKCNDLQVPDGVDGLGTSTNPAQDFQHVFTTSTASTRSAGAAAATRSTVRAGVFLEVVLGVTDT